MGLTAWLTNFTKNYFDSDNGIVKGGAGRTADAADKAALNEERDHQVFGYEPNIHTTSNRNPYDAKHVCDCRDHGKQQTVLAPGESRGNCGQEVFRNVFGSVEERKQPISPISLIILLVESLNLPE